jgi:LmbE family N-acetylglucosaminyl deacetylase
VLSLTPAKHGRAGLSLLALGAHSDDIEIGCGGTLLRLLEDWPGSSVHWIVFSADDARESEARASAADFLAGSADSVVTVHRFRENYFPFIGADIKQAFDELRTQVAPDVVFTHRRHDDHQDHRTIGQLTWNTFRDNLILEYEIPKYEGDLGHPNVYVPLGRSIADRKIDLLNRHFASQRSKRWFRSETFNGLMAVRAVECNAPSGAAEAFHARKLTI